MLAMTMYRYIYHLLYVMKTGAKQTSSFTLNYLYIIVCPSYQYIHKGKQLCCNLISIKTQDQVISLQCQINDVCVKKTEKTYQGIRPITPNKL